MVASDPAGAQVTTNDGRSGTTPYSFRVNRADDVQIHISKAGYNSTDITDSSHLEWGYFILDFFWFPIGWAIDGPVGAMFYHDQTMVTAHLEAIAQPASQATPSVQTAPPTQASPSAAPPRAADE